MQGGDISNVTERMARILVVWEEYLALSPKRKSLGARTSLTKKIAAYELNILALDIMQRTAWVSKVKFDVITFMGPQAARAITERMEETFYDFGTVIATTPDLLARELAHHPDIIAVCDPNPDHFLTYGGKGLHVSADRPTFWS